jgi:dynein heavy chain
MFYVMVSIQPKEAGTGGGETREDAVTNHAKDMLEKLPANYDPYEVKDR